jgi:biotin operon repressor
MYHPTTRVLALLELLQTHGRMSGAELAPRLGVDRRTLRRYVGKLEDIGIPITAERGRAGGYALMPGFKLPPMMFTEDETLALSLGLLAARGLGLAEAAPAVASAQAKLERVMPDGLKRRVRAVDDTVRLDAARTIAPADNQALVALTNAAQACRRVVLRYRDQRAKNRCAASIPTAWPCATGAGTRPACAICGRRCAPSGWTGSPDVEAAGGALRAPARLRCDGPCGAGGRHPAARFRDRGAAQDRIWLRCRRTCLPKPGCSNKPRRAW